MLNNRSRRPNGATQTFRRTSVPASSSTANQPQDANTTPQPARYVPPHRNGTLTDTRYSKEQLLDMYRAQYNAQGGLNEGLSDLYIGGWQPDVANGTAGASWSRSEQSRDTQPGPDICWDKDGSIEPLGLIDMDDEEREVRFRLSSHAYRSAAY